MCKDVYFGRSLAETLTAGLFSSYRGETQKDLRSLARDFAGLPWKRRVATYEIGRLAETDWELLMGIDDYWGFMG